MDTREYIKNKIVHDVNGAQLEKAIPYYLAEEKGLGTGDFSLTGVNQKGVDGRIFPDKAIEATTQRTGIESKFRDDVEKVGEDDDFMSLLYFTTHPQEEVESKRRDLEEKYNLDIEVVGLKELVDFTFEIQRAVESAGKNDQEAAFKQVFKR